MAYTFKALSIVSDGGQLFFQDSSYSLVNLQAPIIIHTACRCICICIYYVRGWFGGPCVMLSGFGSAASAEGLSIYTYIFMKYSLALALPWLKYN